MPIASSKPPPKLHGFRAFVSDELASAFQKVFEAVWVLLWRIRLLCFFQGICAYVSVAHGVADVKRTASLAFAIGCFEAASAKVEAMCC